MQENEQKLYKALAYLVEQIEEDFPKEHMTKHLINAIEDACELLNEIDQGANNE